MSSTQKTAETQSKTVPSGESASAEFPVPDLTKLALNLLEAASLAQQAVRLMTNKEDTSEFETVMGDIRLVVRTIFEVAKNYLNNPVRVIESATNFWSGYVSLLHSMTLRFMGENVQPAIETPRGDKRFADADWRDKLIFDLIKQSYLLSYQWITNEVQKVEGVEAHTRKKADFYLRQIGNAISPSNFPLTNPQVLRLTLATNGNNLVSGMKRLLEDVQRGQGTLQIQQTDMNAFEVGRNVAMTPGKVVFQNELMQLIQYTPTTEKVHKRPLVIFPPWINKFYILDLTAEKSFVKWCVDRGYTVFIVSWINPDITLAMKTFEDYARQGVYAALDAVEQATGETEVNTIGYCIGGTLLASTLAHMAANGDNRVKSATFFAAQVDFKEAGDLLVFIDDEQLGQLEKQMGNHGGILEGSAMATAFNMLRSNELIWSYVISNYMLGKDPVPFDLLYWNSDATRMPAMIHLFYLRQCYLQNNLAEGRMEFDGVPLDLSKVKIPIYLLSSREDHIAPFNSVFRGISRFGGPVKFVVAGSGHIAGVINPPVLKKYQYWSNDKSAATAEEWLAGASETPGSWWPDWDLWLKEKSGPEVDARIPGSGKLSVIEDAPGSYVKVKSQPDPLTLQPSNAI